MLPNRSPPAKVQLQSSNEYTSPTHTNSPSSVKKLSIWRQFKSKTSVFSIFERPPTPQPFRSPSKAQGIPIHLSPPISLDDDKFRFHDGQAFKLSPRARKSPSWNQNSDMGRPSAKVTIITPGGEFDLSLRPRGPSVGTFSSVYLESQVSLVACQDTVKSTGSPIPILKDSPLPIIKRAHRATADKITLCGADDALAEFPELERDLAAYVREGTPTPSSSPSQARTPEPPVYGFIPFDDKIESYDEDFDMSYVSLCNGTPTRPVDQRTLSTEIRTSPRKSVHFAAELLPTPTHVRKAFLSQGARNIQRTTTPTNSPERGSTPTTAIRSSSPIKGAVPGTPTPQARQLRTVKSSRQLIKKISASELKGDILSSAADSPGIDSPSRQQKPFRIVKSTRQLVKKTSVPEHKVEGCMVRPSTASFFKIDDHLASPSTRHLVRKKSASELKIDGRIGTPKKMVTGGIFRGKEAHEQAIEKKRAEAAAFKRQQALALQQKKEEDAAVMKAKRALMARPLMAKSSQLDLGTIAAQQALRKRTSQPALRKQASKPDLLLPSPALEASELKMRQGVRKKASQPALRKQPSIPDLLKVPAAAGTIEPRKRFGDAAPLDYNKPLPFLRKNHAPSLAAEQERPSSAASMQRSRLPVPSPQKRGTSKLGPQPQEREGLQVSPMKSVRHN